MQEEISREALKAGQITAIENSLRDKKISTLTGPDALICGSLEEVLTRAPEGETFTAIDQNSLNGGINTAEELGRDDLKFVLAEEA